MALNIPLDPDTSSSLTLSNSFHMCVFVRHMFSAMCICPLTLCDMHRPGSLSHVSNRPGRDDKSASAFIERSFFFFTVAPSDAVHDNRAQVLQNRLDQMQLLHSDTDTRPKNSTRPPQLAPLDVKEQWLCFELPRMPEILTG